MAGNRPTLQGKNITGVSGAQHGAQQNAQALKRAAQIKYEFGSETNANQVKISGGNITGVSGAQHGAQQNAASTQRAGQKTSK